MQQPIDRITIRKSAGPLQRLLDAAVWRHLRKGREDFVSRFYASADLTMLMTLNAFTLLLFLQALRAFDSQRVLLLSPLVVYVIALPTLWFSSEAAVRRLRALPADTAVALERLFRSYLTGSLVMLAVSTYLAFSSGQSG